MTEGSSQTADRPRRRAIVGLLALGWLGHFGAAQGQVPAVGPSASAPGETATPFVPGVYRGRLGGKDIQAELVFATDTIDSVEGSYFIFGEGAPILLAGEYEGAHLSMEESRDGKDVSGTWAGEIDRAHISGLWRDADETLTLPFELTRIAPPTRTDKP
jgi:hypothetical protein